jgi:hypothetical protein
MQTPSPGCGDPLVFINTMFREEQFTARVWAEAKKSG